MESNHPTEDRGRRPDGIARGRGTRAATRAQQKAFLVAYIQTGSVTTAARVARCGRSTHYAWMAEPGYASRFEAAREEAIDLLEGEAQQRAVKGVAEPVIYKGRPCYREVIDKNGEKRQVPLVIRRYSDALLMFLLKALKPEKYREHYQPRHSGEVDIAARLRAGRERVAKLREEKP